jgi:glycosyltransferase involved in cell wall biosynthesis
MQSDLCSVAASVVLLTYNQEAFVREALQSLLDQDYENLEIVVSDDCSKDGTWNEIVKVADQYKGAKRLVLHQNSTNVGLTGNYDAAFALTLGDVVFSAAGDDISVRDRCSACIALWLANDCMPDLIGTDAFDMDIDGKVLGIKCMDELKGLTLEQWASKRPYQFGASHMLTRRLLALNTLGQNVPAEDQCFVVRAILMGGAARLNVPKVYHRQNGMSGKVREKSFQEKIVNMRKGAQQALLELDQMRRDAECLGQAERFDASTIEQKQLRQYILAQLQSRNLMERWALFCKSDRVRTSKKIRFFLYANFSWWFLLLFKLKVSLNG